MALVRKADLPRVAKSRASTRSIIQRGRQFTGLLRLRLSSRVSSKSFALRVNDSALVDCVLFSVGLSGG